MKKKALLSVSNKDGIVKLARVLIKNDYDILATGNTAKLLIENDINCLEISEFTDSPEIFSGRVKSLHPKIFGGILLRRNNKEDILEAAKLEISPIDIVCVNLYPFANVVNDPETDDQTKIENIDIGGPSLIRAAAKNHQFVSVLTNPDQYDKFIEEISKSEISEETKHKLAADAFSHTAYYDTLIANYFEKNSKNKSSLRINYPLQSELRYGENPHQKAFLYGDFYKNFEVLHGKELSYNNIIDLVSAVNLVNELDPFSCAIIKHTNPCGVATASNVLDAYINALSCDPVSSFGGIVAFNNEVDESVAEKINEIFTEVICAPSYTAQALEILKRKKNRRLLKNLSKNVISEFQYKNVPGGVISQDNDDSVFPENSYKIVTDRKISDYELMNLKFAWTICKHTKSNAIVFCKDMKAIGVGAGQMSRVDSSRIAVQKAQHHGHNFENAVAASDAFFPFADGVEEIAQSGIMAIVQPGGSVRDEEVIEAANKNNISMIFTGIRNFKH